MAEPREVLLVMILSAKQLVRNVINMAGAYIGRKLITFVYFTLIARLTSVEVTGFYFLLISFGSVVTTFMDFGLSNTLIREASRAPVNLQRYLGSILGFKAILSILVSLIAIILLAVFDYATNIKCLIMMLIIMMIFESFSDTFYACLRIHHKMRYEVRALVIGQLITLVFGGLALWFNPSLYFLLLALVVGQMYHFFYSVFLVVRELRLSVSLSIEKAVLIPFMKISIPFLIAAFFGQLLYADTFILKYFTTDRIVGLFSIPSSLVGLFRFIPMAMETVIFPAFSSFHVTSQEKLSRTFEVYFNLILSLVVPAAIMMSIGSEEIIRLIFGSNYLESSLTLRILSLALIPLFLSHPVGRLLDACGREVIHAMFMGISVAINLILTAFLIKSYGAVGIAWACLIGHVFLLVAQMWSAFHILKPSLLPWLAGLFSVFIVSIIMSFLLKYLKTVIPFIPAAAVAGIFYLACLIFLRGISRNGFNRERAYGHWITLTKRVLQRG